MYLHSSLSFHILDDMPDNDVNIAFREAAIIDTNSGPNIERRDKGKTYSLPSEQQTQLMALYQAKYARFASLVALYEAEKHRARHARKLSAFPPMSSWQPQSRHLSPEEATMMQGGDECVIKYQFVHVMTKGIIRGAELEAERREGSSTKSSFVFLKEGAAITPSFGRVQYFFQHCFAGQQHHFAVVDLYGRPQQDARTSLWYVPSTAVAGRSVVEINNISKPLVTAPDGDKLWFLNN